MHKDIRVVIVEDDPFARNWMTFLLVRDWRTKVIGELDDRQDLETYLKQLHERVDLVIVDTDAPESLQWLGKIHSMFSGLSTPPRVVCTGLRPNEAILKYLSSPVFAGYVIKGEVLYAIGWVASLAIEGNWVITPSIQPLAIQHGFELPDNTIVVDGRVAVTNLTESEARVARLAFMFSLERRDLADELDISPAWGYGVVSTIYTKLGMDELLAGEVEAATHLGNNPMVLAHLKGITARLGDSKKASDMETLAFHLMSSPDINILKRR